MTQWWCASCLAQIALDNHGRCSACGSDAVDRVAKPELSARRLPDIETRAFVHINQKLVAPPLWKYFHR